MNHAAAPSIPYSASSCTPSNQCDFPSRVMIAEVITATASPITSKLGKTRFIPGWPMIAPANTSIGAMRSAICVLDPRAIWKARSVW